MKKFAKIFLTVVGGGLLAFSCVTDTTEDLGVNAGKTGVTEFAISLEESRTQLGDRDAEGKYPLYWSVGDQIAINGNVSEPLQSEGTTSALFQFKGAELTAPYCVVYPAQEGAGEGTTYPVTFATTQPYTVGTFAPNTAPLYGYAEAVGEEPIQLNHLTGVLRLAVKGNGEAITSVVAKSAVGKIAGPFTVDCTNGALVPQDGASNTVTVTFAEPLVLGAEAQHIYIAVPTGSYGEFAITLHTAADKMTVKFNTTSKPITLGMVREFKEFTYQANDVSDESSVFEIDSKDALIEFANAVNGGTFAYTAAAVVANIDMSGYDWTPVDGFNGLVFDGGKNEGYAINGLNAPLFGTTASTIQNLNLTNVNIASNGRLVLGAVACVLAEGEQSNLTNCKVSGTITVNNPDVVIASNANLYLTANIGGVVGTSYGDVTNCVNEANLTINQIAKSDNAVVVHPAVGGIVGYSVSGSLLNCVNGNEAKTAGAVKYLDNQAAQLYIPHVGGIAGWSASANKGALNNNTNYGAIEFSANAGGTCAADYNSTTIGGIISYSAFTADKNNNYGTITVSSGNIKGLYVGGVAAIISSASLTDCHNRTGANIWLKEPVRNYGLVVAGVAAHAPYTVSGAGQESVGLTNDGSITIDASTDENVTLGGSNNYRIAGVIGYTNRIYRNCENKANGDITLSGNIILARNNYQSGYNVGGVCAYNSTQGAPENNINRGDINVYTNVVKHSSLTSTTPEVDSSDRVMYKLDIGGVVSHTQIAPVGKEENYGHITIGRASGEAQSITANGIYIGGVTAQRLTRGVGADATATNNGNITINSGVTLNGFTVGVFVGGCSAYNAKETNIYNNNNNGAITVKGTIADKCYLGGVAGYVTGTLNSCANTGAITTTSTAHFTTTARIAGAAGHVTGALNTVKNNTGGNLNIEGNFDAQTHFAGVTGYFINTLTSCENHGNITVNATTATNKALYIAGIVGEYYTADNDKIVGTFTDCINTGDIALNKCTTSTGDIYVNLAGIVGCPRKVITFTNCSNSGTISTAKSINVNATFTIGGFVGSSKAGLTFDNCHNSMKAGKTYGLDIQHTIKAGAGSNQCRIGGLIGWHSSGIITTRNGVSNSADIYIGCINNETGGSSYGGFAGVLAAAAHSLGGTLSNSGDIIYEGKSPSGTFSIGGLCGQSGNKALALCENLINTGDITIKNTHSGWKPTAASKNGLIGGIMGIHGVALSNAKFYGTITAIGFEDDHGNAGVYNAIGGIVGSVTSANLSHCHIGGHIRLTESTEEDAGGEEVKIYTPGALSAENYFQYLSGAHTFTAAEAKAQNCGYISTIDATPVYAE